MRTIYAADLFAGAGGATLGLVNATERLGYGLELVAVNHWDVAVETHQTNFPAHVHFCQAVDAVHPLEAVPGGYLDLLVAGPECTHFSRARGGKPKNKQSRASAFDIIHWLEVLYVQNVIIENVKEFKDWGPLYPPDHPDPKKRNQAVPAFKGRDFRLFIGALEELGYAVEWRLLKACDFGDPTSRERLFLQATRSGSPRWPVPSHCDPKVLTAFPERLPWRTAREIIDWSRKGTSIYRRDEAGLPPLAENTLKRIFAGVRKFAGLPFIMQAAHSTEGHERRCYSPNQPLTTITIKNGYCVLEPLLVVFRNNQDGASLNAPLGTVCKSAGHFGLVEPVPFLLGQQSGAAPRSCATDPAPTVATAGAISLTETIPFLFANRNNNTPKGPNEPVPTLCTGNHIALCQFLASANSESGHGLPRSYSLESPVPTVTAQGKVGGLTEAVCQFLTAAKNERQNQKPRTHALDAPMPTVTASGRPGDLVEGFLVRYNGGNRTQGLGQPITTLDASNRFALCQFVVEYYGEGRAISLADPLGAVTTRDRFGLVELSVIGEQDGHQIAEGRIVGWLDILFRMLQPHELAAAQGFPDYYRFCGTREEQVAQIGNAWAGHLAEALCFWSLSRPGAVPATPPDLRPLHKSIFARTVAASHDLPDTSATTLFDEPAALAQEPLGARKVVAA